MWFEPQRRRQINKMRTMCEKKTSQLETERERAREREKERKNMSLSAKLSENFPYSQHYPHLGALWLISTADRGVRAV